MKTRIIAKLDVKSENVVKPIQFEGLRKVGKPQQMVKKYYEQGADEIYYIDIVASLYRRKYNLQQIMESSNNAFVPFAVGGGVQTLDDFSKLFHSGADKVVINTFAIQEDPSIINRVAEVFGSQSVVVNIEAKKWNGWWECYTDCGRVRSSKDVINWAKEVEDRGAGEILIQSVDADGRQHGFDNELIGRVVNSVNIPVVAASGASKISDIKELVNECAPSGVAIASLLHYGKATIFDIRKVLGE